MAANSMSDDGPTPFPEMQGSPSSLLLRLLVFVLGIAIWVYGLNFLFQHFTNQGYLVWYIKHGALVSILTAFLSLTWEGDKKEQARLLSWHPGVFVGNCLVLAVMVFKAIGANLSGPLGGLKRKEKHDIISLLEALWDGCASMIMSVLMMLAIYAWLLVIAPGFYLLSLITGAPARRALRGTGRRIVLEREGQRSIIADQPSSLPVTDRETDISLGSRPFALTNALNAAVVFLAQMLIGVS